MKYKGLVSLMLFIAMIAALTFTMTKFQLASAFPSKPTWCADCHAPVTLGEMDPNVTVTVTEISSTETTVTYSVEVTGPYEGPEGWAVFDAWKGTNILNGFSPGTFTVDRGYTYYVLGVDDSDIYGVGKGGGANYVELVVSIVPVLVHDVAITGITAPSTATEGDLVSVVVDLANTGDYDESFDLKFLVSGSVEETRSVTLAEGATTSETFNWTAVVGTHMLAAEAVVADDATPANNYAETSIDVNPVVPVHDVAITGITVSPTEVVVGDPVTINVTARNEGNIAETFNVSAYYDSVLIDTQTGVTLSAGVNTTLTFMWNTIGVDLGTYTISANATVVPGETNTTDNTCIDGTVKVSSSTISCTVSPTTITLGENVTVSGSTAPPHNATVTLTYTRPDDTTVTRTVSSISSGAYNDTYTPDQKGTWTVKASWPGDVDHPGGATSELQLFTVGLIDASSPTISINSPAEGATTTSTTMTFNVFADDPESGIKKIKLYIDGQLRGHMSHTGSGIYTLEVTGLDAGTHTWYAKVYNGVGLTNETPPRTFTIQIEEAKPDLSSYITITIVIAMLITLIGAASIWKLPTKPKPT